MIKGADFLFEAVHNSIEAGADRVYISWRLMKDGIVQVRVLDNGNFQKVDNAFEKGVSTRGSGRGMGLYYLKREAITSSLERVGDETVLSFTIKADSSSLIDVLPFLFSISNITFFYKDRDKEVRLSSNSLEKEFDDLSSVAAIANMKKVIRESLL